MIFFFSSLEREIDPANSLIKYSSSKFSSLAGAFIFRTAGSFSPSLKLAGVLSSG